MNELRVGQSAPAFHADAVGGGLASGAKVQLSALRGQKVVLYFYPKDDTPGCTTQACALRDSWQQIQERALLYGVSVDSVQSHEKFIRKHELPFPLLSDPELKLVIAYGMWVEKSLYGKKYMGTERTTVVIDEQGKVSAILKKIKPAEHLSALLAVL